MIMRGPGIVFTHEAAYLGLSAFEKREMKLDIDGGVPLARPTPIIMRKEIGQGRIEK